MKFFSRAQHRLIKEATTRFGLPPRIAGYRYLPSINPRDYVTRLRERQCASHASYSLVIPEGRLDIPLPCNLSSRSELPSFAGKWGFSFHDVPDRVLREIAVATVPDCRVLTVANQWGDESFAIVTKEIRSLNVRATGYTYRHAELLRDKAGEVHLDRCWWILEQWSRNYAHWLIWHLSKICWIHDHGCAHQIMLPPPGRLSSVVSASIKLLGIDSDLCPVLQSERVHVGEISFLEIDAFHPALLGRLRDRITARFNSRRADRKVFLSRSRAQWRHLENEEECWRLLGHFGYERICMESLSFPEQVAMMSETRVLLSPHGAGLANMIFMPLGSHIVEIYDPAFPNPHYYSLAGALSHHYWLLEGLPVGESKPGYDDIAVNLDALRSIVDKIERGFVA